MDYDVGGNVLLLLLLAFCMFKYIIFIWNHVFMPVLLWASNKKIIGFG